MLSMPEFAFPGLAQVPCQNCGHPRGIHRHLGAGSCNPFCGCVMWIAPGEWDLHNVDYAHPASL